MKKKNYMNGNQRSRIAKLAVSGSLIIAVGTPEFNYYLRKALKKCLK